MKVFLFSAPCSKLLWYNLCVLLVFSEVSIGKFLTFSMPDIAAFERRSFIHFCYIKGNIIFGLICIEQGKWSCHMLPVKYILQAYLLKINFLKQTLKLESSSTLPLSSKSAPV